MDSVVTPLLHLGPFWLGRPFKHLRFSAELAQSRTVAGSQLIIAAAAVTLILI